MWLSNTNQSYRLTVSTLADIAPLVFKDMFPAGQLISGMILAHTWSLPEHPVSDGIHVFGSHVTPQCNVMNVMSYEPLFGFL